MIFYALVGKGVVIVNIRAQRKKGRRRYSSSIFRQTCAIFRYLAPFYNATYRTGNIPLNMDCHNPRVDLLKQIYSEKQLKDIKISLTI